MRLTNYRQMSVMGNLCLNFASAGIYIYVRSLPLNCFGTAEASPIDLILRLENLIMKNHLKKKKTSLEYAGYQDDKNNHIVTNN